MNLMGFLLRWVAVVEQGNLGRIWAERDGVLWIGVRFWFWFLFGIVPPLV